MHALGTKFCFLCGQRDDVGTRLEPRVCDSAVPNIPEYLTYIRDAWSERASDFLLLVNRVRALTALMEGTGPTVDQHHEAVDREASAT